MSVLIAHTSHNFGELRTRPEFAQPLNWIAMDAQSAVSLFFVLSGFLITYLMLEEQTSTGQLDVVRFYIRRALRIWPLYYLTALIGLLLIPELVSPSDALSRPPWPSMVLVLILLPNLVSGLGPIEHLWTIGLEEQFYLAWPWVVRRPTALVRIAVGVILVKIIIAPAVTLINADSVTHLYFVLRFECMAIGALGAYIYQRQHPLLAIVYHRATRALVFAAVALLALAEPALTELGTILTSLAFILLLLNVATGPAVGQRLDIPLLDGLGKMSYGIYMYHYPILYAVLRLLNVTGVPEGHAHTAILYASTIGVTLLIAALSSRWYERPFIALKGHFAVIDSRP